MVEIRFHGRGGQGTVVASKILADAIAKEGNWVQAYPEFGVERRGSPVVAFLRIDDKQIFDKSRIYTPDHVVVVDPTLVEAIDITDGLKPGGTIVINSDRRPEDFPFHGKFQVRTINATEIAVKIVNTAIAGAVVKIFGAAKFESLAAAIRDGIGIKPEDNVQAAREAFEKA
ncbi:MAG: 2-oxoacid:acceptor oxidoreductase family protein [Acidobacteria bacterium]|nr:2-oxoacid:acceptor oxidoreductase family protein [Acidobacteriota bacterium]